jgi:hypothetical protein
MYAKEFESGWRAYRADARNRLALKKASAAQNRASWPGGGKTLDAFAISEDLGHDKDIVFG